MTPERYRHIGDLYHAAMELEPRRRDAFLDEASAGDESLRREVASLIASAEQAGSFIESPAIKLVAVLLADDQSGTLIGQHIGHYEIISLLGRGGMGEVYLAKDKKLDRQVAVKILNEKLSGHESNLQRFISEAKAASALNHPNILTVYEFGEAEDAYFIVSEYVEGKTLRGIIHESRLGLSEVLDISIQIAGALSTAHKAHLIHRDIKPENVMIRPDGYVKILDFGLAKLIQPKQAISGLEAESAKQNETAKGVIMGTVNYMSPEQAKGEKVDERTDIFSFGAVIYEMIAGRTPFMGNSMLETFANLINQEPQSLSRFAAKVPDELQRIVSKMLSKNKDERYKTMKDVLTDLKDVLEKLRFQGELEKLPAPEIENPTGRLAFSTGAAKEFTSREVTGWTAELKLAPTNQVIESRPKYRAFVAIGLILAVALATIGYGLYHYLSGNKAPLVFRAGQARRLTSTGRVNTTVISPDGNFTIYAQEDQAGRQSLWMQHVGSQSSVQIVPSSDIEYRVLNITPDGNSIYYLDEKQSIYQIPVLGGTAKKIADGLLHYSAIGFSPDGKQFTFVRRFEKEASALFIINADGTNERKLVSIEEPRRL
jgi:serine/threonine protein kinase